MDAADSPLVPAEEPVPEVTEEEKAELLLRAMVRARDRLVEQAAAIEGAIIMVHGVSGVRKARFSEAAAALIAEIEPEIDRLGSAMAQALGRLKP